MLEALLGPMGNFVSRLIAAKWPPDTRRHDVAPCGVASPTVSGPSIGLPANLLL